MNNICDNCGMSLSGCLCEYGLTPTEKRSNNPCFECIDKNCINCPETFPDTRYQRAWNILIKKLNGKYSAAMVLSIKTLMTESMIEAMEGNA